MDAFGSTHPVLSDADKEVHRQYKDGTGAPQFVVMDRELTIHYHGIGEEGAVEAEAMIESLL